MAPNDWSGWSNHVLAELSRLNRCYESLRDDIEKARIEIAGLKVKAGVWGAVGALIPVVLGASVAVCVAAMN